MISDSDPVVSLRVSFEDRCGEFSQHQADLHGQSESKPQSSVVCCLVHEAKFILYCTRKIRRRDVRMLQASDGRKRKRHRGWET